MASVLSLIVALTLLPGASWTSAQQHPARTPKAKAFEISHGNLFEALRQMAAYRELDLVIDPEVPNRKALYAFKHTTWEKALEKLLSSHGLSGEIKDGILHVSLASRTPNAPTRPLVNASAGLSASRTIAITYHPSSGGEALLSMSVNGATRAEILDALTKVERLAKSRPGSFSASWVLRPPRVSTAQEDLETFSLEDVTPSGLRALYP